MTGTHEFDEEPIPACEDGHAEDIQDGLREEETPEEFSFKGFAGIEPRLASGMPLISILWTL